MLHRNFRILGLLSLGTGAAGAAACSAGALSTDGTGAVVEQGNSGGTSGGGLNLGAAGNGAASGGGLNLGTGSGTGTGPNNNGAFPAAPIVDAGVDTAAVSAFEANPAIGSGVCIFEPHLSDAAGPGALYPQNWLRPRFRWEGQGNTWELTLEAPGQINKLRVYTKDKQWLMPKALWETIASGVQDIDIKVTVRSDMGAGLDGGTFRITGALAGGSMVFWGTESSVVAAGTSRLYGFTMGDEAVLDTLDTSQVTSISKVIAGNGADLRGDLPIDAVDGFAAGAPRCIGCHSATPDGGAMIFTDDYPWDMGISSVTAGMTGAAPAYVTAGARQFMKMPFLGTGMMLKTAWDTGDRTLIATMGRREDTAADYIYINYGYNEPQTYEPLHHDLIWIDLQTSETINETLPAIDPAIPDWTGQARADAAVARGEELLAAKGTAWGVLISEGNLSIANPAPAKTSNRVAYSVSESSIDGHPDWHNNTADIKIADLTNLRGSNGAGAAVTGASDPNVLEYYPAFSPDDKYLAFNRAPAPSNTSRCRQGNPTVHNDKDSPKCNNSPSGLGENPDGPYYNRKGEIYLVPSAGGTPHRLRGNDPVACSGEVSPGVINSWPKWSSAVRNHNGKNYYFVIFSSARKYPDQFQLTPTEHTPPIETKSSQLYMSVVEEDPATGALTSYGAIYLWNQNYLAKADNSYETLKTANMTPAWEDFTIPAVPKVEIVK